jgi:peptide/nickel transport system ATP-binding protein
MTVLNANQDRANLPRPPHCASEELLSVCDLSVDFQSRENHRSIALRQTGFTIAPGEIVGILGESGSGKTTLASAIMQLLPVSAQVIAGRMHFRGENLSTLNAQRLREIRGSAISLIHQNSDVLNPVMRVGDQIIEVLRSHKGSSNAAMKEEVYKLLAAMGFDNCDRIFTAYPHQLSGGQRRRITIAQALICKPCLVIADEPSAWLDPATTEKILSLFRELRDLSGTAFLLISHDFATLSIADRVLVMYAGEIVEDAPLDEIQTDPKHPYTRALLDCGERSYPARSNRSQQNRFLCIPGQAPDPSQMMPGCAFASRCSDRMEICDTERPELVEISARSAVRCFKYAEGD